MGKVEHIEQQVASLAPEELASFRTWFVSFDADAWDRQIASDAVAGRLDALADAALEESTVKVVLKRCEAQRILFVLGRLQLVTQKHPGACRQIVPSS